MRILIITTLLMLLTTYATAQLYPPVPGLTKTSQEPQQKPYKNHKKTHQSNCGSENFPCIVKLLNSPNSNTNTANGANNSDQESPKNWRINPDWWIVIFTGGILCVGLIQAGLFFWQLILQRRGLRDTKNAADAAKDSAIAAITSQRPWLSTELILDKPLLFSDHGAHMVLKMSVKNVGDSPANRVMGQVQMLIRSVNIDPENLMSNSDDLTKILEGYNDKDLGFSVFPKEKIINERILARGRKTEIDEAIRQGISGKTYFDIYIRSIVRYSFVGGTGYTIVTYKLLWSNDKGSSLFDLSQESISAEELRLEKTGVGGTIAM